MPNVELNLTKYASGVPYNQRASSRKHLYCELTLVFLIFSFGTIDELSVIVHARGGDLLQVCGNVLLSHASL